MLRGCFSSVTPTHVVIDQPSYPVISHVIVDEPLKVEATVNSHVGDPGRISLDPIHIHLDNASDVGEGMTQIDADTSCPVRKK